LIGTVAQKVRAVKRDLGVEAVGESFRPRIGLVLAPVETGSDANGSHRVREY